MSETDTLTTYQEPVSFDSSVFYTDTIIRWMTFEEAEKAQQMNPRKVFVNIYATWCRWCRVEDSLGFKNREIAHYINQHYYPVKFNAETRTPVTFKGIPYFFEKDETVFAHQLTSYLLNGKLSYPGAVFLDEKMNLMASKTGYLEPAYFESLLNYYADKAYKTMSFYDFDFEFIGKIKH